MNTHADYDALMEKQAKIGFLKKLRIRGLLRDAESIIKKYGIEGLKPGQNVPSTDLGGFFPQGYSPAFLRLNTSSFRGLNDSFKHADSGKIILPDPVLGKLRAGIREWDKLRAKRYFRNFDAFKALELIAEPGAFLAAATRPEWHAISAARRLLESRIAKTIR